MRWLALVALLILPTVAGGAIPPNAQKHIPTLREAFKTQWPAAPLKHISCGQIEQESSWKENATLKTPRELGRGLVQMTITKRFNIYLDAVKYKALRGWDWQNDPYNTKYQLMFLVLQDRSNYSQSVAINERESWMMTLVRYNAGGGRIAARRRYATAQGTPTDRWIGGLEDAHGPLENSVLYGRPLWKAVNEYPRVIFKRAEKYVGAL